MRCGNETPNANLDIGQSLFRMADVYSYEQAFIQIGRSLFATSEGYSERPKFFSE